MSDSISKKRAAMPAGTNSVLDTRTITKSNANLIQVLKPGQTVLDVGCGSGAITHGITGYVGAEGLVIGVDRSENLINQAKTQFAAIENLSFYCADILDFSTNLHFDVITTARTLQWIANPQVVVASMKSLLKPNGILCVLDYDHTAINWEPEPPASMQHFYQAFLQWRADAGMDNQIGQHVGAMMEENGLQLTEQHDQSEYLQKEEEGFATHIDIWAVVAETRGKQMVDDSYITEEERLLALTEYRQWSVSDARSMKLVLKAVHAMNK
ncbi:MAG: methyltransferase domain-containing protein [Niastella sp.]|uniref:methyltransferase domain-containing protein n=1 Tax=Niastella sp. TaxID=1869183 RepID=UPI00389ABA0C